MSEESVQRSEPVSVVYVLGIYRSGTTLLSNLLGQCEGYFCVGELRAVWRGILQEEVQCGCGHRLLECEVWRAALGTAFGNEAEIRRVAAEMLELQTDLLGWSHTWRRLPGLLRRSRRPLVGDGPVARYGAGLGQLYGALAQVTGARVIVDSSKEATDAAVVRSLPGVRPTFVHIVRDPRGTVYSALRIAAGHKEVDESRWGLTAYTALHCTVGNFGHVLFCRTEPTDRWTAIRYEDFVDQPKATLERITRLVGAVATMPMLDEHTFLVGSTHTVAGNLNRFRTGPTGVRDDVAWRAHLHPVNRALVTGICLPMFVRYRYPIAKGRPPRTETPE